MLSYDFHMHTTVSDGTDDPLQLLSKVIQKGIDVFAVTDHDATKGAMEIRSALNASQNIDKPKLICGVEFSCKDELGKYHILGYAYDTDAVPVNNLVRKTHEMRVLKTAERLKFLEAEFGMAFKFEDIVELYKKHNPGKPHIARMMMKYGYADSVQQAMNEYLDIKKFPDLNVKPEEAIADIIASGGVPVLAHPSYGSGTQMITGDEMDKRLKRLIGFGLEGVECFYSEFSPELVGEMLSFARKYNLYVTAGSDYHGFHKTVELGYTGPVSYADSISELERFVERCTNVDQS